MLIDESIKRSREGIRAVALALAILAVTAIVQAVVFALSGSLALLADLIHNGGDALTAIPLALVFAGAIGFVGNWLAAQVRTSVGRRLESPALIADGAHARADAYVSLAVIASATAIAFGAPILDPTIGLAMTAVILRITRESWLTVRGHQH